MRIVLLLAIAIGSVGIAVGPRTERFPQEETVSGVAELHAAAGASLRLLREQGPESDQRAPQPLAAPPIVFAPGAPVAKAASPHPCHSLVVGSSSSGQPRASRGPPARA